MAKKFKYPVYAKVCKGDDQVLYAVSQLYKVGVYIALYGKNNNIIDQGNYTPAQAIKYMDQFKEDNLTQDDLTTEFGREMIVSEVDNFWEEVDE